MKRKLGALALHILPKHTLTECVGRIARKSWSRHLIPWYVRHYQINTAEAEFAPDAYTCLGDFFSRRLQQGARRLASADIISPVDGTISECGSVLGGQLLQAKGCDYSLAALLGDSEIAQTFLRGEYVTIYLSPHDYHRIHMPIDGTLIGWQYIPGALFPVNRTGVRCIDGLFTKNERLVTRIRTSMGQIALVKIGATIVGSIRTPYGPHHESRLKRNRRCVRGGELSLAMKKGDEIGHFEFGSTVILIFEPGMVASLSVAAGQSIRMGEPLAALSCG